MNAAAQTTPNPINETRVPADRIRRQIEALLRAWGMDEELLTTTARIMAETDLYGVDSHGISMLMDYDRSRRAGKLNLHARPRIVRENAVTALVDGDAGLGHVAADMGMRLAMERAKKMGVGVVTVRNSHHFGAAGIYARMASAEGLLGMCMSSTRTINTVPTRSSIPLLGTNPIAFSAPAGTHPPFSLDMATSTSAANKVRVHALRDKPVPAGWVLDGQAQTVTDPHKATAILFDQAADKTGGLTPVGSSPETASHKGYGLAMMVHILAGTLPGASFSPIRNRTQKPQDPDNVGHFFCAIDPAAFRDPDDFIHDMDEAIDVLHAAPPVDPDLPVLVAGDPEIATKRERLEKGVPIPATLWEKIEALCAESGAEFVLG